MTRFTVDYTHSTVTVSAPITDGHFDDILYAARELLRLFRSSRCGSTWGCDGVGYGIQKKHRQVRIHKSSVGPRNFQKGLAAAKAEGFNI